MRGQPQKAKPSFDLEVLAALDAERALITRLFFVAPSLNTVSQIYHFQIVIGDPSKAPEGMHTLMIDIPRSGARVRIMRLVPARLGGYLVGEEKLLTTELPGASFEAACQLVHAFVTELAK